jgi:hypothetical protein
VYYAGGEFLVEQETQIVHATLIVGYEYALTANTNLNIQGTRAPASIHARDTNLDELLENKYPADSGLPAIAATTWCCPSASPRTCRTSTTRPTSACSWAFLDSG